MKKLKENKILVTGATGSLGKYVCEYLARQNLKIIATGRNLSFNNYFKTINVEFKAGDLTDKHFVNSLFESVDYVIHCAALTKPYGPWLQFKEANIDATENIKNACIEFNIKRLVHISTPSIYYSEKSKLNLEEDKIHYPPLTYYAKSKLRAEGIVDELQAAGVEFITLRPRAIFSEKDTVILPRLLRIMNKGFFPLVRRGRVIVDLTYVDNIVHAIELALVAKPEAVYKKYNITNGEPRSLISILKMIEKELNLEVKYIPIHFKVLFFLAKTIEKTYSTFKIKQEPPITSYGVSLISLDCSLSIESAKKHLNYKPIVSLEEGLKKVLDYKRRAT